jgi:hypothetical protein
MYASNREGNFDLYTLPRRGGNPVRVTKHPAARLAARLVEINGQIFYSLRARRMVDSTSSSYGGNEQRIAAFGDRPFVVANELKFFSAGTRR